jgi:hypothetical protein
LKLPDKLPTDFFIDFVRFGRREATGGQKNENHAVGNDSIVTPNKIVSSDYLVGERRQYDVLRARRRPVQLNRASSSIPANVDGVPGASMLIRVIDGHKQLLRVG